MKKNKELLDEVENIIFSIESEKTIENLNVINNYPQTYRLVPKNENLD